MKTDQYLRRGNALIGTFGGIAWFTECKRRWIPEGRSYDGYIAEHAARVGALLG